MQAQPAHLMDKLGSCPGQHLPRAEKAFLELTSENAWWSLLCGCRGGGRKVDFVLEVWVGEITI